MNVCLPRMAHFHSQEEVKYSYEHLAANATINGDCLVYGSTGKYHDVKVRHFGPGRVLRIYAHRLALLKKMNSLDIPKTVEASHLCHEKACIKLLIVYAIHISLYIQGSIRMFTPQIFLLLLGPDFVRLSFSCSYFRWPAVLSVGSVGPL